ncbi:MAG: NAD(P)-dependent alcohol dehydrogenase [bacterium]
MHAVTQLRYGPADVLALRDVPTPAVRPGTVLVEVQATAITQGDRRMRAADFLGFTRLFGRLITGLFRPRHAIPGTVFAGRVAEVGAGVTRYAVGDAVFGCVMHGAHAQYLVVEADGPVGLMPEGMRFEDAAELPYSALTAWYFLNDLGHVQPGQRVLVLGASGGVGRAAVQLARHLGAEVTGVCSRDHDLVRSLGAHHILDHTTTDFAATGQTWHVIFDTPGVSHFAHARRALTPTGRYLTTLVSVRLLARMAWSKLVGGQRGLSGVAMASPALLADLRSLVDEGALRPVVDQVFPLARIADAHRRLEARPRGAVVVSLAA